MTATATPLQQPLWPDSDQLDRVRFKLGSLPPLVSSDDCERLRLRIAEAQRGEAFLLQGGDCAETFDTVTEEYVLGKLRLLLQMSVVLMHAARTPVVKIGRIAGQYGKPRSADTETRGDVTLPSYRGDAVNSADFTVDARTPDPRRLLEAYHSALATLNVMRGFLISESTDIRNVCSWNSAFLDSSSVGHRYRYLEREIRQALDFLSAARVSPSSIDLTEMFVSHEALLMDYEEPLFRSAPSHPHRTYGSSGHMLWIGERTRKVNGYHVRSLAKLSNPIGIKIGPSCSQGELLALLEALDPECTPGRITLISRMGVDKVSTTLPGLISVVESSGHSVLWSCDPMHGNTRSTSNGYKTRRFEDVRDEVSEFFEVHRRAGTWPGGIHLEMSGDDVTECTGGGEQLDELALERFYQTTCDPRLNRSQAVELAFLVAEELRSA